MPSRCSLRKALERDTNVGPLSIRGALLYKTRFFSPGAKRLTRRENGLPYHERWPYVTKAVILLNKPVDFECSMRPTEYPSVLRLLPAPLRYRGVQPVGRLDADTTGLLLLTDDGALNHRLTHPKHHIEKTYRVTLKHAVKEDFAERLLNGVVLKGEKTPVKAEVCTLLSDKQITMTVTSGKYHQVKRMVAAAGNRVMALHRESMGGLKIPEKLAPGCWMWVFRFPWDL